MCPLRIGLIGPGDRKSIQPMAERPALCGELSKGNQEINFLIDELLHERRYSLGLPVRPHKPIETNLSGRHPRPAIAPAPECRTRGPGIGQFAVIQAMAPPHAVEFTPINANDPAKTQTKAAFASSPNGGLEHQGRPH
jgi:hypothetical protein